MFLRSVVVFFLLFIFSQAVVVMHLDYFNEGLLCTFKLDPPNGIKSGNCSVQLTTTSSPIPGPSEFIIGKGRELFVEVDPEEYNTPPAQTGRVTIQITAHTWSSAFGNGNGGISEYTLDGFMNNPKTINPVPPEGLSGNPNNKTDLTIDGGYAIYFEVDVQITSRLDLGIFDINFNKAEAVLPLYTQQCSSSLNCEYTKYIVPFSEFTHLNITRTDFSRCGAIDFFIYGESSLDASFRFPDIIAAKVSGRVYYDCVPDCTYAIASEKVSSNQIVVLQDSNGVQVQSTVTDNLGVYSFFITPGTWKSCLPPPFTMSDLTQSCQTSRPICTTFTIASPIIDNQFPGNKFGVDPAFVLENLDVTGIDFPLSPSGRLVGPPDRTISCSDSTVFLGTATVQSECSNNSPTITYSDVNTIFLCPNSQSRTFTRIYRTTDSLTVSQVITVQDVQSPTLINIPLNTGVTCGASTATSILGFPSATDDCSTPVIIFNDGPILDTCRSSFPRTFTATDACGKVTSATQFISITDTVAPEFSNIPTSRSVDCTELGNTAAIGADPFAVDACGNGATVHPSSFNNVQCGSIVRSWTVNDVCGNVNTATQFLTVIDDVPPRITPPADTTLQCGDSSANLGTAIFDDNCGASLSTGVTTVPSGTGCGFITRTFTASDGCSGIISATQIITFRDDSPPVFSPTSLQSALITCNANTSNLPAVTASDSCSGLKTDGFSTGVSSTSPLPNCGYQFTRTWTAINNCNLPTTLTQLVIVTDNDPPTLIIPQNTALGCSDLTAPGATTRTGTATATDQCSGLSPINFTDISGSGCTFTIMRIWNVQDTCGNSATSQTQIITVRDNTPPTFINFPPDKTIDCTDPTTTIFNGQPQVTDTCNTSLPPTFSDQNSDANCPLLFTIVRTWTAFDACNNPTSSVQIINIRDDQNPSISAPPDISVLCNADYQAPPLTSATPLLQCSVPGRTSTVTYTDSFIQSSCPIMVSRTWKVKNLCGTIEATDTQIISLTDNIPPNFNPSSTPPTQIEISCSDPLPEYTLTGSDNCDNDPTVVELAPVTTTIDGVGRCPDNTRITRTWIIKDDCQNPNTFTQTVIVDNTPVAPCTPVDCIEQPCDTSSCESQECDCCRGEALPCNPVNCAPSACTTVDCTPVPCSGCDFPTRVTTCQPKVCPPQYIFIDDDDAAAMNRGPITNVKKAKTFPGVSGAGHLVVSLLLVFVAVLSIVAILF